MKLEDFDYELPKELIAQRPLDKRDASRMLVVHRATGQLEDRLFSDLPDYVPAGDVMVFNDTKVFPARLQGKKKVTLGKVEVLLLAPASQDRPGKPDSTQGSQPQHWACLLQPSLKVGQEIVFEDGSSAVFIQRNSEGIPVLGFFSKEPVRFLADRIGSMPIPPYIKREPDAKDISQYQTVYAAREGAVACPTAGLHFSETVLEKLSANGVRTEQVTLHVGYGTFRPVEDLENHRMHAESFELRPEVAQRLNEAKADGKKIWAVGTTTLRTLETCVLNKVIIPGEGKTDLYIRSPFTFEAVDRLLTNFHLPKTTLLLLVSAFMGETLRKKAYAHAVKERYRFYSYGDAMLIL